MADEIEGDSISLAYFYFGAGVMNRMLKERRCHR